MRIKELGYKEIPQERIKNIGEDNGEPIETFALGLEIFVYDLDENDRLIFDIRSDIMSKANHKLGLEFPNGRCCNSIKVFIDGKRINSAIGLYPLDDEGKRMKEPEGLEEAKEMMGKAKMDWTERIVELEVGNIKDIALLMNEETFNKFCELWRIYHNAT